MFSWLEEVERKSFNTVMPEHKPFRIEKMQLETVTTSITELGQLFTAASFLLSDNTMVQLPARDLIARNLIISEIAPHFKEVKVVLIDNKIEVVMMQYLKDTSRQMLQDLFLCGLYPVVSDMYRSKEMNLLDSHKPRRAIQRYRAKDELLEPLQLAGTLSIQQFVESAYFTRGDFLPLSPTGWKLEDELRHSITLRTFCYFVPHIELVVDVDDLSVVGLELYPA